ncbi:NEAT domain-containing protein, partial [uncultured Gemella sp.]|uniref:NEAT domain-containing protein n=1 Tax=uncultured Gemella sp. TaxID=254352 RepID=UPI0028D7404F
MTKKYNSKFIAGLAVPICLTITTTGISNPILNTKLNIAYAQGEQSEGFKIYEAEIGGSGSLEFTVEGKDSSNDIFNKYWKNVDKLLIDGKDFGFDSESSASKNYTLYGNTVYISNKDIEAHYNKQKKHKIEFIFKDGSKAAYEDEGYVEPSTATSTPATNTSYAQKDLVTNVEKNSYGDELNITLADGFKAEDVLKNTKEVIINGKTFNKNLFSKNWKGQIVTFDDGGDSLKAFKAWNFDGDNTIVFKANDGSESKAYTTGNKVAEEKPADNKSTEKQDTPATNTSYAQKDLVTNVEKNSYGDELNITLADGFKAEDVLKNTKEVIINGKTFNKSLFSKNWKGQIVTFDDGGESLKAFKAWNFDGENSIIFKANDDSESKAFTTGNKVVEEKLADNKTTEKQGEKTYSLTDKLEDGEYTLGFNALYADGRQGTSMLEGFFDKNVKLVVKDGKMSITMLNTLFAHGLYDFAIQNKGKWASGVKENFGEKNSAGQYDKALFTLPVEDLDQIHLGGVIVSYMGSLESDKGNFDKYTTVKLKFKPEIKKGWNGFELVEKNNEERKKSDDLLQKKLIANGVDTNKDGKVTEDELKNFTGDINIGSLEIDGKVDKGAIYNLDLLKHMGPGVKSFSSDSNNLGELPEDLFKNAVNIERINLGGNGV